MKENTNILLRLSIFVIAIMIFFGSMITNLYILQAISCGLAILSTSMKNLKIKKDTILWILVCLVTVFSLLISQNKSESIKIVILTIIMVIIKIYKNNYAC